MPVLAAPPPLRPTFRPRPAPASRPSPTLDLPNVSFFGRTLAEYAQYFALDLEALRGHDVLDVGAGPSSFTAEACARRIDAVAVDPFYGAPADDLAAQIEADYRAMFAQIRSKPRLFKVGGRPLGGGPVLSLRAGRRPAPFFESLAAAEADRRAAAQRFLADYQAQFAYGRYVGGALPRLPFFDRTFDLVLCAHLLFVYAARFDFDWHLAAVTELVRVSAGEVRIHPLCGPDGRTYARLPMLRRELRAAGVESDVVDVNYEFFVGTSSTLVLRRATP